METSTIALLGLGAFLLYKFAGPGAVLSNLRFVENGMSFDVSNPLRIIVNLSVVVQNPTSGQINLLSLAGTFSINGQPGGNVSYFTPTVIAPNSQTQIVLQLSISDANLLSIITNYIASGSSQVNVSVNATANANNIPIPVNLNFSPL